MDTDVLISLVFSKPPLWDKSNEKYRNRYVIEKCWKEISEAMNQDEYKLRKKWKYLRDQFSVEYTKIPSSRFGDEASISSESKWPYYKSLMFLKDVIKSRNFSGNLCPSNRPSSKISEEIVQQTNDSFDFQDDSNLDQNHSDPSHPDSWNFNDPLDYEGSSNTELPHVDCLSKQYEIEMTSSDTYQLKWHSHSSHLNGSVAALLRSERFTDVVLCTMDGSQIPAHKFILSSCSVYLSSLLEGQRSVSRMGGMLYVVLPSEISTKALKILVEYMYKGETTVSNEVLDTVLKAGEILKIRGLWRQADEDTASAEKTTAVASPTTVCKQPTVVKKPEEIQTKIALKKDDKIIKAFNPVQPQGTVTRPMFIGPPKLVFIKTSEAGATAGLRPGAPKGQTILVAPAPQPETSMATAVVSTHTPTNATPASVSDDSTDENIPIRTLRRHAAEKRQAKRLKTDADTDDAKDGEDYQDNSSETSNVQSACVRAVCGGVHCAGRVGASRARTRSLRSHPRAKEKESLGERRHGRNNGSITLRFVSEALSQPRRMGATYTEHPHRDRGRAKQDLHALQEDIPLARLYAHTHANAYRGATIRVRTVQQGLQCEVESAAASAHAARPAGAARRTRRAGTLGGQAGVLRTRRGGR
ncbi:uncharacterized protein [Battus philenor]|uniref:uncharacterized protein isoform X4 n=1 Tax=Battus philenor TaxID=42288 RepID=UPI0035D109B7